MAATASENTLSRSTARCANSASPVAVGEAFHDGQHPAAAARAGFNSFSPGDALDRSLLSTGIPGPAQGGAEAIDAVARA